ncbi:MAG TPA: F0F1 ATP synthase subunit delta [Candidatus Paceibacterota bacterium]
MKNEYAQAFLEVLKDGTSVETALAGLKRALEKKQHEKLLAPVLLEVQRVLEAEKGVQQAVIAVASQTQTAGLRSQIDETLKQLGVSADTPVKEVVDETLIGGFVASFDHKEYDQSYKTALKSLYESITK